MSSCYWHPLRHATVVAIESSAARDRYLFPSLGRIQDKSFEMEHMQSASAGSSAKRQKTNSTDDHSDDNLDTNGEGSSSLSAKPYLCTGVQWPLSIRELGEYSLLSQTQMQGHWAVFTDYKGKEA